MRRTPSACVSYALCSALAGAADSCSRTRDGLNHVGSKPTWACGKTALAASSTRLLRSTTQIGNPMRPSSCASVPAQSTATEKEIDQITITALRTQCMALTASTTGMQVHTHIQRRMRTALLARVRQEVDVAWGGPHHRVEHALADALDPDEGARALGVVGGPDVPPPLGLLILRLVPAESRETEGIYQIKTPTTLIHYIHYIHYTAWCLLTSATETHEKRLVQQGNQESDALLERQG